MEQRFSNESIDLVTLREFFASKAAKPSAASGRGRRSCTAGATSWSAKGYG
jgi:hypothetical protein